MSDFIKLHDKDKDDREFAIRISEIKSMYDFGEDGTQVIFDNFEERYTEESVSEILRLIEREEHR